MTDTEPASFSAEEYFATQPPPPTLDHDINGVREFVARQAQEGRKVVLVTVRRSSKFINIRGGLIKRTQRAEALLCRWSSMWTRGATSAEYFLKAGYAVIFMHRQFSLQPFSRHYSHSTNPFLDFLEIEPSTDGTSSPPRICVTHEMRQDLLEVLTAYKSVHAAETLHTMTFVTVNDYLWLLRAVTQELSLLGKKSMYYLAAAVSDFFLPRQKMSEHKIQSGKGSLHIEMDQVPKILKPMVTEWTKGEGFIVSFKLETDGDLLIPKARAALDRYGHQVVIGNDLHRRKFEVVFVSRKLLPPLPPDAEPEPVPEQDLEDPVSTTFVETWIRIPVPSSNPVTNQVKEIEEGIITELVKRHDRWIDEAR
ncbi:hypothetical protein DXG03_002429 [Asterophora parasitica]|uniref:DNA/pantothenate metabolism flavoprotein C-terminal domain-containing protein n=1 Tax=Asterophora parasitica TaxID=117018 RepID=A0A9P7GGL2_9AGAR|nr:hypothetical protein DXG03_002429 [Asterophora parasitica]